MNPFYWLGASAAAILLAMLVYALLNAEDL
ncbi:potassium-transporting ATPase subunit F [Actimicrobium sp. CCC2.4]|nr:potassium-transporting ATPase subunit F [Actimicrobium sp. CCC2.4]MEB0134120.1 potassium-transporting ATPase subunit F [Actimicrobium sp. CCC2.4]NDP60702.1 potassium-transporting ATPase subunit F [Oxalobacteraceae bacterium]WPX32775.1 potassium-transporting ATPase subunit F [Actimicrobium sp. CCC2.4]